MISREKAIALAEQLSTLSGDIKEIYLVGSLAHKDFGNDADFVVVTDIAIAQKWWKQHRSHIKVKWPWYLYWCRTFIKRNTLFLYHATTDAKRLCRLKGAARLLGIDLENLKNEQGLLPEFEMFLLPLRWQKDKKLQASIIEEVTPLISHKSTRGFLENLAQDAERVV